MRILSMTATFGKLRGARLELGEGFHVIEAPNEGGKSTWCAFLRAMFYGIPTRERDKQGYIAEKNRYQPWSGGAMEGEMELLWKEREVTLRRGSKGGNPFCTFSAVYTDTGEAVPGLTGENCGEVLLGVSREVYERSAFLGQGSTAIRHDAELERRIAALVSSGEEGVSFTEAERKLKEWCRRRRYHKFGMIPQMEEELAQGAAMLTQQEQARNQAEEAQREIERLTVQKGELSAGLERYKRAENRGKREKYQAAQESLRMAQGAVAALASALGQTPDSEQLRGAQGNLAYYNTLEANRRVAEGQLPAAQAAAAAAREQAQDERFPGMNPDEAWQKASRDRDRAVAKPPRSVLFAGTVLASVAALLWLVALALLGLSGKQTPPWMYGVLGGAAGLAGTLWFLRTRERKAWRSATQALLNRYGVSEPEEMLARANRYRERGMLARELERKVETLEASVGDLARQKEELFQALLVLVRSFEPSVTDSFGISAALSKGLSLQEKHTAAQIRLEGAKMLAESLPKPEEGLVEYLDLDGETPGEISPDQLAAQLAAVEGELARWKNDLARITGERNTLGDRNLFLARREALQEEYQRRQEEYEALTVALEGLNEANSTLQARFSPALNASAGRILCALTGGRYEKIGLNRQFEAEARETGGTLPRSTLLLSKGTAEQVYLAVRMAVCAMALPTDDPAPLVLDDVLAAFDNQRLGLALDYLLELALERQILLFSCHSRERAYLEKKDAAAVQIKITPTF